MREGRDYVPREMGRREKKKGKEKQVEEIQRERYTGEWHNGD